MNQLYRSNTNKIISGVCGGVAEYLSVSPDMLRAIFIIGTLISRLKYGFIVYVVAMLLIPEAPPGYVSYSSKNTNFSFDNIKNKKFIGIALIALGVILTVKKVLHIDDIIITSIVLIAVGIYILAKGGRSNEKK